jgi:predicted ABC-type ATPase
LQLFGTYINADDIKMARSCDDLAAAQEAEMLRELHLEQSRDFTFETVLSTSRNLKLLKRAKAAGYSITGVFVLTANPKLNVMRVQSRVIAGGHEVPEQKIIDRYQKSLNNIPNLIELCERFVLFDNTDIPEVLFMKQGTAFSIKANAHWNESAIRGMTHL